MKLSFIVPAHNEKKTIEGCLNALKSQTKKPFEVIVVNDGSTDDTAKIAKKFAVKIINFNKGHSAAFARNAGASQAKGEYLIFIDADMIVEKTFIEKIEKFLKQRIDGSDYLVYSYKPETIFQKAWACYRKCYPSLGFPHIIRKSVFKKLNGFNEKIFYFEDEDLKQRFLNKGFRFEGPIKAIVHHIEVEGWKDFARQRKWQGKQAAARYFLPCLFPPLELFVFIKIWKKSKELKNSFYWCVLDLVGRYISLAYRLKFIIQHLLF